MNPSESLNHTKWDCKYHIIWIPKYRKKTIFNELRPYLGAMLRDLATQKGCTIIEGHLLSDHVHILIAIPPKYAISQVVGFIKGKSAIWIARTYAGRRKNFTGQHFWATFQQSEKMKPLCVITSGIKKMKTDELNK